MKTLINKYILLIFIIFISFTHKATAQYLENNPTTKERIFVGGNIGISLGRYTNIMLDPNVGYRLTNRLSVGTGLNFAYLSYRYNNSNYKTYVYGGNLFASFTIIKSLDKILSSFGNSGLLLHSEINITNIYPKLPTQTDNKWLVTPLLGISFQNKIGENVYFQGQILYNFNQKNNYAFSNPIVIKLSTQIQLRHKKLDDNSINIDF